MIAKVNSILGAIAVLLVSIVSGLHGCDKNRHMVLAATGTNIGVEISQNPATQQPQAKLGYQRTELAIVPSNRSTEKTATSQNSMGKGASDVADVIMELRYGGIFDVGATSGIYQRLAVGTEAVRQPGASFMFAKDANGNLTEKSAEAVKSVESIKTISSTGREKLACVSAKYGANEANKTLIDTAVKTITDNQIQTFDKFYDSKPTDEKVKALIDELRKANFPDC